MISKIKKPVSILLALMMVVSLFTIVPMTASAETTESLLITINSAGHGEGDADEFISGSRTFDNIATVTFSSQVYNTDDDDGWYIMDSSDKILSVAPAAGYTITKVKFYNRYDSAFDETSPFEATLNDYEVYVNGSSCGVGGVNKIEVYGYATPAHTEHTYTANPTFNWSQDASTGDWNCNKLTLTCSDCDATQDYEVAGYFGTSAVTCTANTDGSFTYSVSKTVDGTKYEDSKTYNANSVVKSATQLKAAAKKGGEWELGSDIAEVTGVSCADGFVLDGNNKTLSAHTFVKTSPMFKSANKTAEYTLKNLTINGVAGETQYQPAISSATTSTGQTNVINLEGVTITNYDFDAANNGAVLAFGQAKVNLTNCNIDTDSQYDVWGGAASKVNVDGGKVGGLYLNGGTSSANLTNSADVESITAANGSKIATDDPAKISVGEDYKLKDNGDGTYTVVPKDYVAQVGTAKYETLDAAIAAAQAGDTVKLLSNVSETVTISGKTLTLDLNGFNITSASKKMPITAIEGTKLTIINSNAEKAENTATQNAIMGPSGSNNQGSLNAKGEGTTVDIYAGYYYGYNGNKTAINAINGATVTFWGGTVNGAKGINDTTAGKEGKVFYSGVSNPTKPYATNPGYIVVHGGNFSGRMSDSNWGKYLIDGGTFDRNAVILNENPVDADGNRVATANSSMTQLGTGTLYDAGWLADGYIPKDNGDGTYTVGGPYAAKIGDTGYATLEAAFAAAADGNTITLLANCAGNGIKVAQGKYSNGLTVDFGGYTYTVDGTTVGSTGTETNGFQLLKDNKITFRNGAITSTKAKILVQNYSNLTLDNMTLTLNNPNYTGAYTLSNNNGDIVIDGTTINANPAGGFAFDVCRFSSYPSVNVTVTGNSIINGSVEVSASKSDAKDGFSLTLESGTMTGNIVVADSAKNLINNGGTVNKADAFTKAAPEGFVWVDSATSGIQTLAKAVAKIDTTNYATLEAAFAAAQDGETITLLADCAGNGIKAPQGKFATGLTVDFDGHTYTVDGATVGSTGTETNGFQLLKDNKITFKNGTITSTKAKILVQNYSNLTLDGMTLTLNNENYTSAYTLSNNNGDVVINNTTINANPAGGFAFDVCRYSSYPSVNVTVTGESKINGDVEVYASKSDPKNGFSLKLEGGEMSGDIVLDQTAKNVLEANPDKLSVTKAAGFNQAAPEGYVWVDTDTEGVQTLAKAVAQIGDKKYATLEAAFAAAQDSDTITLLANCAGNGIKAPQGKFATGLTVDFDGHTYTVDGATVGSTGTETNGFQLLKDNTITFKNGTITSEKAKILVQNYSNLTLDGMTLTLNNTDYNGAYTLSDNNGNVVINNTTINANPTPGSFAFDVCRFSSYPSVNVTVTGESKINGNVEVSATKSDPKNGFSLNLNGGTMTGAIVLDETAKTAMEKAPEKVSVNKATTFDKAAPEGYKWVDKDGKQTLAKIVKLFTAHSITLNGNIELNFFINPDYANFDDASSAKVKFSWDGNTAEVNLKTAVLSEDGWYKASVELVAAEMANVVHAEVYLGNEKIGEDDYTVREYAEELYKHPEKYDKKHKPEELRALAKAMLNYGAMAQTVFVGDFTVKPEDFANANLDENDKTAYASVTAEDIRDAIPEQASNMEQIGTQLGGKFYTSSVIYLNQNKLRLYFTPKSYPGTLEHRTQYSGVVEEYYYYVDSQPIPAAELDQQQHFKIGNVEFNYSALDYAKAVVENNKSTEAVNLAKALFCYYQAAKAYC